MASPNNNQWPRLRWTTFVALAAACAIGVAAGWWLQRPPLERLAESWGRAIAEQDEAEAIISVARLGEFDEAAIPWWAEVLTDPREEVLVVAIAALDRETARWQSLGEDALSKRWEKLINEIEVRRSRFSPTAWSQIAMVARRGVSATHGMRGPKRTAFLLAAESLLHEAPIHAVPAKANQNVADSDPIAVPTGENAALMALASPVTKNGLTDEAYSKSKPPPGYTARLDRRAPNILTQGDHEEGPREHKTNVSQSTSAADSSGDDLRGWSEVDLMKALQSSDRFIAASAAKELKKKGYRDVHINAAQRLFDADPLERRRLVDELPSIRGIDPRPWLEQLARDENEAVRNAAEATLQTAKRSTNKKGRPDSR